MTRLQGNLAIQWLRLSWSKGYRGAEAGAVRNAIDREPPFVPPGPSKAGWFQQIRRDARSDYMPVTQWHDLSTVDHRLLPVSWRCEEGNLRLKVTQHGGKIRRPELADTIAHLPFGERIAIRFNNASDGDHQRLYSENVIQVGWSESASLSLPLFRDIDLRELLY